MATTRGVVGGVIGVHDATATNTTAVHLQGGLHILGACAQTIPRESHTMQFIYIQQELGEVKDSIKYQGFCETRVLC